MFYEKKIKYLDYLVSGEKKRGAGFVKAEVRDKELRLWINVNGIYTAKPLETDIVLKGKGKEAKIRRIRLNNGVGDSGEIRMNTEHLGGGLSYGELEKITIPLSEKCEIVCLWNTQKRNVDKPLEAKEEKIIGKKTKEAVSEAVSEEKREEIARITKREEDSIREETEEERRAKERKKEETEEERRAKERKKEETEEERRAEERKKEETEEERRAEERKREETEEERRTEERKREETEEERSVAAEIKEDTEKEKCAAVQESANEVARESQNHSEEAEMNPNRVEGYDRREKVPFEDKWRQLAAIYPHMDMAAEISDCIIIKPADFVIFPQKFYSMVTNSFLLHGYHNYGHLVLARVEKRGEIKYYIGVPGVFFDKERQVALMFGFESFECGKDFAQTGDFGYYMIRVEL